ncbi:unnamed protein product, partial [Amoebophrya sp. A25]
RQGRLYSGRGGSSCRAPRISRQRDSSRPRGDPPSRGPPPREVVSCSSSSADEELSRIVKHVDQPEGNKRRRHITRDSREQSEISIRGTRGQRRTGGGQVEQDGSRLQDEQGGEAYAVGLDRRNGAYAVGLDRRNAQDGGDDDPDGVVEQEDDVDVHSYLSRRRSSSVHLSSPSCQDSQAASVQSFSSSHDQEQRQKPNSSISPNRQGGRRIRRAEPEAHSQPDKQVVVDEADEANASNPQSSEVLEQGSLEGSTRVEDSVDGTLSAEEGSIETSSFSSSGSSPESGHESDRFDPFLCKKNPPAHQNQASTWMSWFCNTFLDISFLELPRPLQEMVEAECPEIVGEDVEKTFLEDPPTRS